MTFTWMSPDLCWSTFQWIQMPVAQAHVDGNGLQEDLLQPVLDSLSQLFKDSNPKVLSVVGTVIFAAASPSFWPSWNCSSPCHAGLSESHTSATHGGSEAWHSFGFLQQLVLASLGTTQHALKHVHALLLLPLLLGSSDFGWFVLSGAIFTKVLERFWRC